MVDFEETLQRNKKGELIGIGFMVVNDFLHDPEVIAYRSDHNKLVWKIKASSRLLDSDAAKEDRLQMVHFMGGPITIRFQPGRSEKHIIRSVALAALEALKDHCAHQCEESLRFMDGSYVKHPHPEKKKKGRKK